MNLKIMGIYREAEYSPGKVDADAAIIDAVLAEMRGFGVETVTADADNFARGKFLAPHMVLAMCQGQGALSRLAAAEQGGAVVINSALAIRNCYRDLLGAGLMRAGVPVPEGVVISTAGPLDLKAIRTLDLTRPLYIKRGDLHALANDDVQRVTGFDQLETALNGFARRGVAQAYVQQEVLGEVVKFYGVSGGEYFATVCDEGMHRTGAQKRALQSAASVAAGALGLEVWGGDAVIEGDHFSIIDFNDWPSFSRVRAEAARAIARRSILLLRRHPMAKDLRV